MPKRNESFNFKWKLTENYFNVLMVLVGSVLIFYALIHDDVQYIFLAGVWGLICPFIATFIDKKSHEGR